MALTRQQKIAIKKIIVDALLAKLQNYKPKGVAKPFHAHLLGKDRLALYSFIQSCYTNFGTTVFETVAEKIAAPKFKCTRDVSPPCILSSNAQSVISDIMNELSRKVVSPNQEAEIQRIRDVCQLGEPVEVNLTKHDLFLESRETGDIYLIDMKTVKPNRDQFKGFKRTLLEWYAVYFYEKPDAIVYGIIAPPYNPYDPKPYNVSTAKGIMDLGKDLRAAEEFWNFLGGEDTYTDLLGCFRRAGVATKDKVDERLAQFN